jgi:hypothetical protein
VKNKNQRGGVRKNAGAKPKYNEETKTVLNNCFTIDENIQALYEECINSILESEYFELTD